MPFSQSRQSHTHTILTKHPPSPSPLKEKEKKKILLHVPLKSLILAIEGLFLHWKAINVEILWVKVSNLSLGIYIYIYIYIFSLASHKGSYLHLMVERYSDLLSKLDSYAFLSSFFFYIHITLMFSFSHTMSYFPFHFFPLDYIKNCALMERERERERESLLTLSIKRRKKNS